MTKYIGQGTQLWVGATMAAVTATVQVAGIKEITPPTWSRGAVDVSDHDITDNHKQYLPEVLADNSDLSLTINYDPGDTVDALLETLKAEKGDRYFEIRFPFMTPNKKKHSFRAFLTEVGAATPLNEQMTRSITLKANGAVSAAATYV